jgi:GTP-binding protein
MKPIIALVGRPNVGKSTLFNRLTRSRDALVADIPGLTRDRKYGIGRVGDKPYTVVDTGGLTGNSEGIEGLMQNQAKEALVEAHAVIFLVDGRAGMTAGDVEIAQLLRQTGKPIFLALNKSEGLKVEQAGAEFYALGLAQPYVISAAHGDGVRALIELVLAPFDHEEEPSEKGPRGIRISIVGRPNVGKSTLVNRILGEERVLAFDMPGTTRDSIEVPFEREGQPYVLIDTAGVRKRKKVSEKIEKFSVLKAIEAMEQSNIVVLVIDGSEGVTDQDASLLGLAIDSGRALVIAVNKWDGLSSDQRDKIRSELELKLAFVTYARIHFISALHGSGVGNLFTSILEAFEASLKQISTRRVTQVLKDMQLDHQPPMVGARRIKMRMAHMGGHNPPIIVVHGSQVERLPASYVRYMENKFREVFGLWGTPMRIELRNAANPFDSEEAPTTDKARMKKQRDRLNQKLGEKKVEIRGRRVRKTTKARRTGN